MAVTPIPHAEESKTSFQRVNRVAASAFGTLGHMGLRYLAFPKIGTGIQELLGIVANHFMPEQENWSLTHTFRGISLAHLGGQCVAAYGAGPYGLMTTVGLATLHFVTPWAAQKVSTWITGKLTVREDTKQTFEPWVNALCILPSALIPTIQVDTQGVEVTLPFTHDFYFFTPDWTGHGAHLGQGHFGLTLSPTSTLKPPAHAVISPGVLNENVLEAREMGGNLHVIWGNPAAFEYRIFPNTKLALQPQTSSTVSAHLETLLSGLDETLTQILTFPFHNGAVATPTKKLIPVRHPSDNRELPELLTQDPKELETYLNNHYKKYVHETSYSTAPAIFGTLFHDLGLKTGGHVYQNLPKTDAHLLFDQSQFLFVPSPQDTIHPIILCELDNYPQRNSKAKDAAQHKFIQHLENVILDVSQHKTDPHARFLAQQDPDLFEDIRAHKAGEILRHPIFKYKVVEDFEEWLRGNEPLKTSLDGLAHGKVWEYLNTILRNTPELQEKSIFRIAIKASLGNHHKPFHVAYRINENLFNPQRQRLDSPARLTQTLSFQDWSTLQDHLLYNPTQWHKGLFNQEKQTIADLLTASDEAAFRNSLQNFQEMVQTTQKKLIQPYPQEVRDEAFYKGIIATKMLDHMRQGGFFPMVEWQSGSGRIDLALIPRQGTTAIIFELKDAEKSVKSKVPLSEKLHISAEHALKQAQQKDYGSAFNRIGVEQVWRVGASFGGDQMQTNVDFFKVPKLSTSPITHLLSQYDELAFRRNLDLFFQKHVSYHDLNSRNPSFIPACLSGMLAQSSLRGDVESMWAHPLNSYEEAVVFLLPPAQGRLLALHLLREGKDPRLVLEDALGPILREKPFLKDVTLSRWSFDRKLEIGGFTTTSFRDLDLPSNPDTATIKIIAFSKVGLDASFSFPNVVTSLDIPDSQKQLMGYLQSLSTFEKETFPKVNRRNEATLQAYLLGSLADHTQSVDILNVNEEGGTGGKRPDFLIRKKGVLTALELKQEGSRRRLAFSVEDAIEQTRDNAYLDSIFTAERIISAGIAGDLNRPGEGLFRILHDEVPYSITKSPVHHMIPDPSTSYEISPDRRARSKELASLLTSPPKRKAAAEPESPLLSSPLKRMKTLGGVCGISRIRHKRHLCEPKIATEEVQTAKQLQGYNAPRIQKGLHRGSVLTNIALPTVKALIRGDIEEAAQIPVMLAAHHTIIRGTEHALTQLAKRMENGVIKRGLLKSVPLVGPLFGGVLDTIDLEENIRLLKTTDNPYLKKTATLNIVADSAYLAIGLGEIAGILAGAGSVSNPAALAASLTIILTQQLVQAGFQLEELEKQIALSESEKFANFWCFFVGLDESSYLTDNIDAKRVYTDHLKHLVETYLKTGDYGTLITTLNDLQRTSKLWVRDPNIGEQIRDAFKYAFQSRGPCYYYTEVTDIGPILTPGNAGITLQPDPLDPKATSSASRILEAPFGTRFICNPNDQNIQVNDYKTLKRHYQNCQGHVCKCQPGDFEIFTQRMTLESWPADGKNFCEGMVGLTNLTNSDASLIYVLNAGLTHELPKDKPATVMIEKEGDFYNLTFGHQNDLFVFDGAGTTLHANGGEGHDTLYVRGDFYAQHRIQQFESLIGTPKAQYLYVPQDVMFVDGKGGRDEIYIDQHPDPAKDQSILTLYANDTLSTERSSLTYILPNTPQQGEVRIELDPYVPQTHWIRIKDGHQLGRIHASNSTLNVELLTPQSLNLVFQDVNPDQHHIRFVCDELNHKASIEEIQARFARGLYDANPRDVDLYLVGNRTLYPEEDLQTSTKAYVQTLRDIGFKTDFYTDTWLKGFTKTSRVQYASHLGQSHTTAITQDPKNPGDSIFIAYGPSHHHYLFQDWFETITLENHPQTPLDGKYEILNFPKDNPFEIHGMTYKENGLLFNTRHKTIKNWGTIRLEGFKDPSQIQIRYEDRVYGLRLHNGIVSLTSSLFLSFNENRPTFVGIHHSKKVDAIHLAEPEIVQLREGNDRIFYAPKKDATIVLRGGCHLSENTVLNTLLERHPLTDCNALDTIDVYEGKLAKRFLDKYDRYELTDFRDFSMNLRENQHATLVQVADPLFMHDVHPYGNDTVGIHFRGNQGEKSVVYINNWGAVSPENRPLFLKKDRIFDIRNFEVGESIPTYQAFEDAETIIMPGQHAHELGVAAYQDRFYITRQSLHTSSGKPGRYIRMYEVEPGKTRDIFFDRNTFTHDDVSRNQRTIYHVLDTNYPPLRIKMPERNASLENLEIFTTLENEEEFSQIRRTTP